MKQKYVMPQVQVVDLNIQYPILAGSDNTTEGDIGSNPDTGSSGGIGAGTGGALAKDHNFNAWETWDEY